MGEWVDGGGLYVVTMCVLTICMCVQERKREREREEEKKKSLQERSRIKGCKAKTYSC